MSKPQIVGIYVLFALPISALGAMLLQQMPDESRAGLMTMLLTPTSIMSMIGCLLGGAAEVYIAAQYKRLEDPTIPSLFARLLFNSTMGMAFAPFLIRKFMEMFSIKPELDIYLAGGGVCGLMAFPFTVWSMSWASKQFRGQVGDVDLPPSYTFPEIREKTNPPNPPAPPATSASNIHND